MRSGKAKAVVFAVAVVLLLGGFSFAGGIVSGRGIPKTTLGRPEGGAVLEAAAGEILVKYRTGADVPAARDRMSRQGVLRARPVARRFSSPSLLSVDRLDLDRERDLTETLRAVRKDPAVLWAEPNYVARAAGEEGNDPLRAQQWALEAVRAPEAWALTAGAPAVTVAVIDTGVDLAHPDLRKQTQAGWDFVNEDGDPSDDLGHGTHCAGIVAAEAGNGVGIAGVAPGCRILAVKALDASGEGRYSDIAEAIVYAADNGAKIISMSFGGYGYSQTLQEAVDYALSKGCLLVAAGGNDGVESPVYPAAYPDVIGVSAVGPDGAVWPGSNRGPHIDLCAPGVDVLSTSLGGGYASHTGTSPAAAVVAGLAALVAQGRTDLPMPWVAKLLCRTASDLGEAGRDPVFGSGGVDVLAALASETPSFHDVAVGRITFEGMQAMGEGGERVRSGENGTLVCSVELRNNGTYGEEEVSLELLVGGELVGQLDRRRLQGPTAFAFPVPARVLEQAEDSQSVVFRATVSMASADTVADNNTKEVRYGLSRNGEEGTAHVLYKDDAPFVHSWIAYQAVELLKAAKSPATTDLSDDALVFGGTLKEAMFAPEALFNPYQPYSSSSWTENDKKNGVCLLEGTFEEDNDYFDEIVPSFFRHFWDPDKGPDDGYLTNHSALWVANNWWDNAVTAYKENKIGSAYYWLGRVAHLLADMSVPDHAHNDGHIGRAGDGLLSHDPSNYEEFTREIFQNYGYESLLESEKDWSARVLTLPTGYDSTWDYWLNRLFYDVAQYTQYFDSSNEDGSSVNAEAYRQSPYYLVPDSGQKNQDYAAVYYLAKPGIDPNPEIITFWEKTLVNFKQLLEGPDSDPTYYVDWCRGIAMICVPSALWSQVGTLDTFGIEYYHKNQYQFERIADFNELGPYKCVPDRLIPEQAEILFPESIRNSAALLELFYATVHRSVAVKASPLGQTMATLKGWANPGLNNAGGSSAAYWFEYKLSTDSVWTSTAHQAFASVADRAQVVTVAISGLQCGKDYNFRLVVQVGSGVSDISNVANFTTVACSLLAPIVTTGAASGVSQTGVTVAGTVNPNGSPTTAWVDYGATASYGSSVSVGSSLQGSSALNLSATLSGLQSGTTYHYRFRATNDGGSSNGSDQTFTTLAAPGNVTATSNPSSLNINFSSQILVTVTGSNGQPVGAGKTVTFSTSFPGNFFGNSCTSNNSPSSTFTDANGQTWINFSSPMAGNAAITVNCPGFGSTLTMVQFINPNANMNIALSASFHSCNESQTRYVVYAYVTNASGGPAQYVDVFFSSTSGSLEYTKRTTNQYGRCSVGLTCTASGSVTVQAGPASGQWTTGTTIQAVAGCTSGGAMGAVKTLGMPDDVYGLRFSPDGTTLIGSAGDCINAWNTSDWTSKWAKSDSSRTFYDLAIRSDSQQLIVGRSGSTGGLQVRRMTDGVLTCTSSGVTGPELCAYVSDSVYYSAECDTIYRYNSCGSASAVGAFGDGCNFDVIEHRMESSISKGWVAVTGFDGYLRVWDSSSLVTSQYVASNLTGCAFSSDGTKLAAMNGDVIKIYDTSNWSSYTVSAPSISGYYLSVVFIDNDSKLAVGSLLSEGLLEVIDLTGASFRTANLPNGINGVTKLSWNESTQELAAACGDYIHILRPLAPADTMPPLISITTPSDQASTNLASLTTTGQVTDATCVTSFTINGVAQTLDAEGYFSASISLAEGANTITYVATDSLGQQATETRTINRAVDHTGPVVDNVQVTPGMGEAGTQFAISAEVVDGDTGVGTVTATVKIASPVNVTLAKGTGNTYSGTFNSTGVPIGQYFVDITAVDSSAQANSFTVTNADQLSIVPPCAAPGAFSLSSPADGAEVSTAGGLVVLSWTSSANASSYDVYCGTSAGNMKWMANVFDTQVSLPMNAKTYFWKVEALTSCNSSLTATAGPWSFTVTGGGGVAQPDANGDGKTDVVGRDAATGTWYVGTSTGTGLTTASWGKWSAGTAWADVLRGDFDGDGKTDLAGRTYEKGDWWVARSTGAAYSTANWGNWSPGVAWTTVLAGDFNGDGRTDIAGRVASSGDWYVAVSTGGAFATSKWGNWSAGSSWTAVQAGDFDGDGKTDLAGRAAATGDWYVALSSGSGFVTSKWGNWSPGTAWTQVRAGDYNGDGKMDLAGRAGATGYWWVALSTGSSFATASWGKWSPGATWVDVLSGDVTGDGKDDLVGRDLASGTWWVGVSDGSAFTTASWGKWSPGTAWRSVHLGDYNGDGKADVMGRVASSGAWYAGLSTGSGFSTVSMGGWSPGLRTLWDKRECVPGQTDLSGDAKADVAGRDPATGNWYVGLSKATGLVTANWGKWSTGVTWADSVKGDFDGDGKTDLAGLNAATGDWWVSLSSGTALCTVNWGKWSAGNVWSDVRAGDYNGDGRADIAGRLTSTGAWWVALSTGTGFASASWGSWSTGLTWDTVVGGDFNGDGRTDLAGRSDATGDWWVALSTGASFTTSSWGKWSAGVTWGNVLAGDFNGDGRTDLAGRIASSGDWYVGVSTGTALATAKWGNWSVASTWVDVKAGDVTGDGRADLLGRNESSGQWWVGRSDGAAFTTLSFGTWSTGVTWEGLRVGDYNGDGRADILGRTSSGGAWYAGLSTGGAFSTVSFGTWSPSIDWESIPLD